jgi:hypothetical protein
VVTHDAATGLPLVSLALAPATPGGRSLGLPSLQVPPVFDGGNPWGYGGDFTFRVNGAEFAHLLSMARTADAALSANAADYGVESFGLKGEADGAAEIGYHVEGISISLVRP